MLDALGQKFRVSVILDEPCAMMPQGVKRTRGYDTRLAKPAAKLLLEAPRAVNKITFAAKSRAHGSAQTLRETDADRVEILRVGFFRDAGSGGRVPDARSIEMRFDSMLPRDIRDSLNLVQIPDLATANFVGFFVALFFYGLIYLLVLNMFL